MINFIDEKMNIIYSDFIDELYKEKIYCKLMDLRFNKGHIPDYSQDIIRQYYLLKYLPAYFVEYYDIYRQAVKLDFINEDFNILSIGCGCGIDLWGCHFVIKDMEHIKLRYTGLDCIDWDYFDTCGEEAYFIQNSIGELKALDEDKYNLIIFPKSIGEFSKEDYEVLKKSFENTNFTKKKILLIASIRSSEAESDISRLKELVDIFKKKGYSILDDPESYTQYSKKNNGCDYRISDIIPNFQYPEDIRRFLTSFYKNCLVYRYNCDFCNYECKSFFIRNPIMTMSKAAHRIIRIKKR